MAKVDVVIPAYNAERTISEAIGSILTQTERDLRLIVVDDGSTDSTGALVERIAAQDRRVTLVSRENGGVVAALQTGVKLLEAPFFARLDADDISAPDRLERQLALMENRPELVASSGGHQEIDAEGRPTGVTFIPEPLELADPRAIPAREPQLIHSFLTMRTEAFVAAGGYRSVVLSEDTDLFWRLMERGPVALVPGTLGQYRMHATSLSSKGIVNVRILSVSSQFAALSAVRRRSGRADIAFPLSRDEAQHQGASIAALAEAVSGALDAEERHWFRAAISAKLMELAGYRPVELDLADCRFIAESLTPERIGNRPEARELAKMKAATAARLFRAGHVRGAAALTEISRLPEIAARLSTGRFYWRKHVS